jgi:hypothetical protein
LPSTFTLLTWRCLLAVGKSAYSRVPSDIWHFAKASSPRLKLCYIGARLDWMLSCGRRTFSPEESRTSLVSPLSLVLFAPLSCCFTSQPCCCCLLWIDDLGRHEEYHDCRVWVHFEYSELWSRHNVQLETTGTHSHGVVGYLQGV